MEDWRDPAQVKHVKLGREDRDGERERGKKESKPLLLGLIRSSTNTVYFVFPARVLLLPPCVC